MFHTKSNRYNSGMSLIETLICIAILSIIFSLSLAAIQKARNSALKIDATNAMRQVLIASHSYANNHGHFPDIDANDIGPSGTGESAFLLLFPLLEGHREAPPTLIRFRSDPSIPESIRRYTPTGPVYNATYLPIPIPPHLNVSSIALSSFMYTNKIIFPNSFSDGTSSTIAMTEHYGSCSGGNFQWVTSRAECYEGVSFTKVRCSSASDRRATFADGNMFQDVVPITTMGPNGNISHGSVPLSFQVKPSLNQCDARVPQSTFAGGILCGMADGSVRFVREGISESIFWGAVTPDKNEMHHWTKWLHFRFLA